MPGRIVFTTPLGPATATPVFTPNGGTYVTSQTFTLSCATPGASIYFIAGTGSVPNPTVQSVPYTGPVTVYASATIKAIAVSNNRPASTIASAVFTIETLAATPTFSPVAGTYAGTQTVTLACATPGASIYYTTDGTTPTTSSTLYSGGITVSSNTTLKAIAAAGGYINSAVGTAVYVIATQAATPSASPPSGTYGSTQTVALSCTTTGNSIYYTLDGTTPTTSSTLYSGSITVSASLTLKAIAAAPGYANSNILTAAYTIGSVKTNILSYLNLLTTNGDIFSGQTADFGTTSESAALTHINAIPGVASGQNMAGIAIITDCIGPETYPNLTGVYNLNVGQQMAATWWGKTPGGLVQTSLYLGNPTVPNGSTVDGGGHNTTQISATQLHQIATSGNSLYNQWQSQLVVYGNQLSTLTSGGYCVLFRPFIEINGSWNWYGGITGGTAFADFQAIWQNMYTYLNVTRGLAANLLWVYNVNQNVGNYMSYYPGDNYVDIMSLDVYADANSPYNGSDGFADYCNLGGAYSALAARGKPLIFSEAGYHEATLCSTNEIDNDWYRQAVQGHAPKFCGIFVFCNLPSGSTGLMSWDTQSDCNGALGQASIANLSDLPSNLVP